MAKDLLASAALLGSMVSFNLGATVAKQLFPVVGVEGVTALRMVGGALLVTLALRPWRSGLRLAPSWPAFLYGPSIGGMNLLLYTALKTVPLGIAIALEFSGPLVVTIASSHSKIDLLWIGLAAMGLLLIVPIGGGMGALDPVGTALALGAGACWALYILSGKRAGEVHGSAASAVGMSIAAIAFVPVGIAHAGAALIQPSVLLLALVVALLSSALPYPLEMFALRNARVQTYGTLMSCHPAIGAAIGFLLLGEALSFKQTLAICLVVIAAVGATTTSMRKRGPSQAGPVESAELLNI